MSSDKESGASIGIGCIVMLAMVPFSFLLRAYVLTVLWGWFIVKLGLPQIGLAHAYGLSIVVHMFVGIDNIAAQVTKSSSSKSVWESVGKVFAQSFLVPLLILFIAWLCHLCM